MISGGVKPKAARWVNVLEEVLDDEPRVVWSEEQEAAVFHVHLRAFEIKTLCIEL
jgi:hypothetical protein